MMPGSVLPQDLAPESGDESEWEFIAKPTSEERNGGSSFVGERLSLLRVKFLSVIRCCHVFPLHGQWAAIDGFKSDVKKVLLLHGETVPHEHVTWLLRENQAENRAGSLDTVVPPLGYVTVGDVAGSAPRAVVAEATLHHRGDGVSDDLWLSSRSGPYENLVFNLFPFLPEGELSLQDVAAP